MSVIEAVRQHFPDADLISEAPGGDYRIALRRVDSLVLYLNALRAGGLVRLLRITLEDTRPECRLDPVVWGFMGPAGGTSGDEVVTWIRGVAEHLSENPSGTEGERAVRGILAAAMGEAAP